MLGGGVFVTQNKVLPGSYINVVSGATTTSAIGERGVVAIALPAVDAEGAVIELTKADYIKNGDEIIGEFALAEDTHRFLREIFCHANKVYIYSTGEASSDYTVADVIAALEPYEFNVLCAANASGKEADYIAAIKSWRDELGKKCQLVIYNATTPNSEGVINVVEDMGGPDGISCAWVAGAMAGCKVNESCTNMLYDGELTFTPTRTQKQLEECITKGQIAFHNVYGEIRLLKDVNSLTTTTADKGEDFKSNQTIRVVDQIANDISKLFNTKYLGKIPNNASGRVSFWGDVVAHHRKMEELQAIENFNAELVTVEQGSTKSSIVVHDAVTPVNAMDTLYMTVVVQ